ncbi:Na/Pi cotransporter family protein [Geosporobacter ferrireducens]|uniref:Na/Pi cotransporter n=1 Tax=Geosporobacter ferrireducens TaxID=1424294 RepID=A0A1D8GD57_9FIRM|nr:Na/Pi symporter [Geosporobacter ferrireducens]AOT68840.1 hypothetical protein Gferi_04295 [Geosporobacter ferrireducens]MTI54927.1 Na/Pi cotransporter family protein [Geosporobacter ferrireducens]
MLLKITAGALAGISIFFLGMNMMSDGILALATRRLKGILSTLTANPLLGILCGVLITALTQSSSGTTVMVVSLVNGGVLNLYQAAAVIMGANLGTTITAQLVSYDFFVIIPHVLFLGILLYHLKLTVIMKELGRFLIGFALLFLGIRVMIVSLYPLKNLLGFQHMLFSVGDHKLLGILLGALTTGIIQSSSTGIALLQGLSYQGLINLSQALPILMGQNIGTCVTTLLSSFATDKNGKRAAIIHLLFNFFGTIILFPFIDLIASFVVKLSPDLTVRQIANAHTLFNLLTLLLLLPFLSLLVNLSKKIIR